MEKIRFGIVGTGFISDWLIAGGSLDPRFEVTALYSRTEERAMEFARKYNIPHIFTSLEKMVSSPCVDAVYIASPNYKHAEQSILCMEFGKHVLCEKPMASNAREVEAMIRSAKKNHVLLMEAMRTTLSPNFYIVQQFIGKIGRVRRYFSSYCQYSSRYDKFKEGIILNAFKPELSNGAIMDIGVYTVYPMIVLFGRPQSIGADGILLSTGVDGQGTANFHYQDMNATVIYSKIADSGLPTEIQGENGNIVIDRINTFGKVSLLPHSAPALGRGVPPEPENIGVPIDKDPYFYEIEEFISLIQAGRLESRNNCLDNSLAVMECIDEIRRQIGVVFPSDALKDISIEQ